MALLLELHSVSDGRLTMNDSSFSPCSSVESSELFHLHDAAFDFSSQEFYDNVSSTSTPSGVRTSEQHQRSDYDTDDSGFCDSIVSDCDLLQMSNLRLVDESHSESFVAAKMRPLDSFPLPKLCLLPHLDEFCDIDARPEAREPLRSVSADPWEMEKPCCTESKELSSIVSKASCSGTVVQLVVPDVIQTERTSVRRQRSPDAVVSRCSRHRLSLDSFSESLDDEHCDDRLPARRSLDSVIVPVVSRTDLSPPEVVDTDPSPPVVDSISSPSVVTPSQSHSAPFDDSVFEDHLRRILEEFSPPCLRQLIGRKMGVDRVDIIAELAERSMMVVMRQICSYLSDADLASLTLVSVQWRNAFTADKCIQSRVDAHNCRLRLVTKLQSKENVLKSKRSSRAAVTRPLVSAGSVTRPLQSCANFSNVASPADVVGSSVHSATGVARTSKCSVDVARPSGTAAACNQHARHFWKEAEKLYSGETLTKCPRCRGPSRTDAVQERGHCTSPGCLFDFCLLCQLPYHRTRACKTAAGPAARDGDVYVGSRTSRRHLRRL